MAYWVKVPGLTAKEVQNKPVLNATLPQSNQKNLNANDVGVSYQSVAFIG